MNIAAGTNLTIRINQHISVKTSHAGDRFTGEVEEPVVGRGRSSRDSAGSAGERCGGCFASTGTLQGFFDPGAAADLSHVERVAICAGYEGFDADEEG